MKKVIWIIWSLASWKDSTIELVANLLNIEIYQISWELKDIARERWIWIERENLIDLSRELSKKYWDWYLAERICKRHKDDILLIAGMRQIGQINYLKKNKSLLLIWIEASSEIRFNRVKDRKKIWDPFTLKKFIEIENKENNEWVQKIDKCMKLTNYIIKNEWNKMELEKNIYEILKLEKIIN